jgi:hypothetical protein
MERFDRAGAEKLRWRQNGWRQIPLSKGPLKGSVSKLTGASLDQG